MQMSRDRIAQAYDFSLLIMRDGNNGALTNFCEAANEIYNTNEISNSIITRDCDQLLVLPPNVRPNINDNY
jgi:hypothetical protein